MSSKDIHEERIMNSNSDSIKIIFDKADESLKNFLNHFFLNIK